MCVVTTSYHGTIFSILMNTPFYTLRLNDGADKRSEELLLKLGLENRIVYTIVDVVEEIEITSLSTKIPTVTEGGKYRVVIESEAGVQTELSFVRKHGMNTAGSIFIMVIIGLFVVGLFTGLVYRNKSKTDD